MNDTDVQYKYYNNILINIVCMLIIILSLSQVEHIKDYLPKACPHGDSMILDSEVQLPCIAAAYMCTYHKVIVCMYSR